MVVLSAPLAVLLFFIVPRIPPLWSIPQQNQATTGISDQITPGDIASLVKSPKEAFRASFIGAQPPRESLYWRALVFQKFDGKTWSRGNTLPAVPIPIALKNQANYRYQIMIEPSGQHWIPTLDTPTAFNNTKVVFKQDRTLVAELPINSVSGYEVSSNTNLASHYSPGVQERTQALRLPL